MNSLTRGSGIRKTASSKELAQPKDVFISYRTNCTPDCEVATRIQEVLERFPIPRSYRKKTVEKQGLYYRLFPRLKVFRDTTDLAASADGENALLAQVRASRWLVLICSPKTPESMWIDKEVTTFRENRSPDRILCVWAHGTDYKETLPRSLQQHKISLTERKHGLPILVDVRAETEKERSARISSLFRPKEDQAKYALLAAIFQCDTKDQLIQRHRRGVHNMVAAALVTVGLALALYFGTIWIERSRYEESVKEFPWLTGTLPVWMQPEHWARLFDPEQREKDTAELKAAAAPLVGNWHAFNLTPDPDYQLARLQGIEEAARRMESSFEFGVHLDGNLPALSIEQLLNYEGLLSAPSLGMARLLHWVDTTDLSTNELLFAIELAGLIKERLTLNVLISQRRGLEEQIATITDHLRERALFAFKEEDNPWPIIGYHAYFRVPTEPKIFENIGRWTASAADADNLRSSHPPYDSWVRLFSANVSQWCKDNKVSFDEVMQLTGNCHSVQSRICVALTNLPIDYLNTLSEQELREAIDSTEFDQFGRMLLAHSRNLSSSSSQVAMLKNITRKHRSFREWFLSTYDPTDAQAQKGTLNILRNEIKRFENDAK